MCACVATPLSLIHVPVYLTEEIVNVVSLFSADLLSLVGNDPWKQPLLLESLFHPNQWKSIMYIEIMCFYGNKTKYILIGHTLC